MLEKLAITGREGVGRMDWSEGGGKWDNCNSIINKYIKKKPGWEHADWLNAQKLPHR